MDIFNIQALLKEGRRVKLADLVPTEAFIQIGVFRHGANRSNASSNAYPSFVIPVSELIAGAGAQTLAQTLVLGNSTGANNISIVSGQTLNFNVGSGGVLNSLATTAARTWNLPDKSGIMALTTDVWLINGNTNGSLNYIGTNDLFDFPIRTNSIEVARFTTAGQLGIGTSTPSAKLHVEVTGTSGIIVSNGVNSVGIVPSGTSAVGTEITTTQLGFEIISLSGYFRFQRTGAAGDALIYGDSNITGLTFGDGSGTPVMRIIYGAPNKISLAIQTGNAGLVSGELYLDTAANVLLNGDLVVASKV